ncbi:RNA methyltransferase [Perlucidibaca aquatica]|uniref:RNA methyltransferase n=1 Tax=Perlucidibaca aquatica TaxID=1852776 RepID=UPI00083ADC9F|nr:RNA methyltransferase [Perlucidibaca aquatica]
MNISTRIILVNTSLPANIGAAARAMKTMGLYDLVLVAPKQFPHADASSLASSASDVLANARVVATLEEAIADCQLVLGTSARNRTIGLPQLDARSAGSTAQQHEQAGAKVAIIFGREDRGLTNEELMLCHAHVFIPTNPVYGVLNVAAAVQVLAYEVRMACLLAEDTCDEFTGTYSQRPQPVPDPLEQQGMPITLVPWDEELVKGEDMTQFYEHCERTLIAVGFLDPENPRQIMTRLRRLFGRTRLDRPEYNLLRGFFKRVLALSGEKVGRGGVILTAKSSGKNDV